MMMNFSSCAAACTALTQLPIGLNTSSTPQPSMYWSTSVYDQRPACYVRPTSAPEVASALKIATKYQCPFAISGGGHVGEPGLNNIQDGITMDLANLKSLTISADQKTTHVGAGLRWKEVYAALDPYNLTVAGGREASVGVAGLTLGGGLSYISPRYGFVTDNVKNFEVVLADGSIVNANFKGPYKDLYKALRGGGNNFGIVTRFDLDTYEQGLFAGGLRGWSDSPAVTASVISAFDGYVKSAPKEPDAHLFINYAGVPGAYTWGLGSYFAKPDLNPTAFSGFKTPSLEAAKLYNEERITDTSGLAADLDATQPYGFRQQFYTASFKCNISFINTVLDIYRDEVTRVQAAPPKSSNKFQPTVAFQPLTAQDFALTRRRGGNSLGLEDDIEPLVVLSTAWAWDSPEDDELMEQAQANLMRRTVDAAKQAGTFHRFYYMNYAVAKDPVIEGYGPKSGAFLRKTAQKYDPKGVFQKLVPGGWKLGNAQR